MAARTIAVAQQKGGAGKTMLVAQLAVALRAGGARIGLVDMDSQQSLTHWSRAPTNDAGLADAELEMEHAEGWRARSVIERMQRSHDYVLIDSPPRVESEARIAIRGADLVLVPLQMSPMDLWATHATLEIAGRERRPFLLVANRVPARGNLHEAIVQKLKAEKLPLARTTLGNRIAFAASLLEGRGVTETEPRGTAAYEIQMLAAELGRTLAG